MTTWIDLVLRWLHVVTGAAWIGTSFYFNWLNNHVRASDDLEEGVAGDLWSVHGGHFYRVVKYRVAPTVLPKVLHWFKWEAYVTWISGASLLAVVYYLNAETMVVDAAVRPLSPIAAVSIGVGVLVVGWVAYDLLCKSPIGRMPVLLAGVGFVAVTALAFGLSSTFGSRAAYIHVGAMLGTMMAANVFFVIIPNQRVMVDAMIRGEEPDGSKGRDAAQRSRHNNYLTLPVLFIMISNHYPVTWGHEASWAILAALSLAGAGVRHWFNLRGEGRHNVWLLPAATVAMLGLVLVTRPQSYADHPEVAFAEVRRIIEKHCISCHATTPTSPFYLEAPLGVMLDTPERIGTLAPRIHAQVVVSKAMPLANLTDMTDAERDVIGAWYYQGARIR